MEKSYSEKMSEIIKHKIEIELVRGRDKFILYPFGELGKLVKTILNDDYNIHECFCVDSYPKQNDIYPLEYLKSYQMEDEYVLVTSGKRELYEELRNNLKKYVSEEKIIDIFEKKIDLDLEYMDHIQQISGFDKKKCIYHLKRYDVKFYLPLWNADYIQKNILTNDCYYEDKYLYFVTKVFMGGGINLKGKTVLDIGANIGNHSIYFLKECEAGKVIAFEPVKETFQMLKKNIEINELEDKVILNNYGVGEKHSNASIANYYEYNIGMTTLESTPDGEIEICALDELELREDIALIKIDVEGFELKVIKGALQLLKKCRPLMMIELHESICSMIQLLDPLGYDCRNIIGDNYIFYCK